MSPLVIGFHFLDSLVYLSFFGDDHDDDFNVRRVGTRGRRLPLRVSSSAERRPFAVESVYEETKCRRGEMDSSLKTPRFNVRSRVLQPDRQSSTKSKLTKLFWSRYWTFNVFSPFKTRLFSGLNSDFL